MTGLDCDDFKKKKLKQKTQKIRYFVPLWGPERRGVRMPEWWSSSWDWLILTGFSLFIKQIQGLSCLKSRDSLNWYILLLFCNSNVAKFDNSNICFVPILWYKGNSLLVLRIAQYSEFLPIFYSGNICIQLDSISYQDFVVICLCLLYDTR